MSYPKVKPVINYRKLGRERAWGLAYLSRIEVDSRLKGKRKLRIIIHEALHILNPQWSETKVDKHSKELANLIWEQGFRRVEG